MSTQDSKYCSFPHCHVFKNGNLVLFPGKKSVIGYDDRRTFCYPFNGRIFVPRTEKDNKIWLEFTKMLYDEDNSFKEAWYPMDYAYAETETFYWLYDAVQYKVTDSDYKLKIDYQNDGQRDFDDWTFTDYDSRGEYFFSPMIMKMLSDNFKFEMDSRNFLDLQFALLCNCQLNNVGIRV
ncbi:hypothetical protein Avbf_13643 [Armadillidium vulgare]|nr:hypothetical protein Avbf_13643 [Armadillidium vulgare]